MSWHTKPQPYDIFQSNNAVFCLRFLCHILCKPLPSIFVLEISTPPTSLGLFVFPCAHYGALFAFALWLFSFLRYRLRDTILIPACDRRSLSPPWRNQSSTFAAQMRRQTPRRTPHSDLRSLPTREPDLSYVARYTDLSATFSASRGIWDSTTRVALHQKHPRTRDKCGVLWSICLFHFYCPSRSMRASL